LQSYLLLRQTLTVVQLAVVLFPYRAWGCDQNIVNLSLRDCLVCSSSVIIRFVSSDSPEVVAGYPAIPQILALASVYGGQDKDTSELLAQAFFRVWARHSGPGGCN